MTAHLILTLSPGEERPEALLDDAKRLLERLHGIDNVQAELVLEPYEPRLFGRADNRTFLFGSN